MPHFMLALNELAFWARAPELIPTKARNYNCMESCRDVVARYFRGVPWGGGGGVDSAVVQDTTAWPLTASFQPLVWFNLKSHESLHICHLKHF
jgi:hypothetical protein